MGVYIAIGVLSILSQALNLLPMYWKSAIMPGNAGNLRSNMQIFKVNLVGTQKQYPYVVMEEDGDVGKYNRANRALHHFAENAIVLTGQVIAAGLVFPFPVFCITLVYAIVRIWYQIAYATGGYGI